MRLDPSVQFRDNQRMRSSRALKFGAIFIFIAVFATAFVYPLRNNKKVGNLIKVAKKASLRLSKDNLAQALTDKAVIYQFPTEMDLPVDGTLSRDKKVHAIIQYAFDSKLQESMEKLMASYKPDYGAFVAMDAKSGRVLSIVSYVRDPVSKDPALQENMAFKATFPSASVFKLVTASAAIADHRFSPDSIIPYTGRNHTLYRSNVLHPKTNRWTNHISLKQAFAKSINTVFGRIGAFSVGSAEMREYAGRFGFNRTISADFKMEEGHAAIPDDPNDAWGIAEASSGYTRENTMSPIQGALMAAAIVNDGVMMEPYLVDQVFSEEGVSIYEAEPKIASVSVDPKTAEEMRSLMNETVVRGTSRKSFRGFFHGGLKNLNVGGKTGSLTGTAPPGKYDWFVGYADNGNQKIAVSALTIHKTVWRVKSSYLARKAIESYFQSALRE